MRKGYCFKFTVNIISARPGAIGELCSQTPWCVGRAVLMPVLDWVGTWSERKSSLYFPSKILHTTTHKCGQLCTYPWGQNLRNSWKLSQMYSCLVPVFASPGVACFSRNRCRLSPSHTCCAPIPRLSFPS